MPIDTAVCPNCNHRFRTKFVTDPGRLEQNSLVTQRQADLAPLDPDQFTAPTQASQNKAITFDPPKVGLYTYDVPLPKANPQKFQDFRLLSEDEQAVPTNYTQIILGITLVIVLIGLCVVLGLFLLSTPQVKSSQQPSNKQIRK